ncbi:hypothetical protein OH77DRAFT_1432931 [Trametes cingulata]|nr:hypothetical protein OH77DRAFT_1432931 [Trametes cingulata]
MAALLATILAFSVLVSATELFDRNLAYSSPFLNTPQLSHDTRSLQARHLGFIKRQLSDTQSADGFKDAHYPTFYGGDSSDSPFIYSGGINFTHSVASGDPVDDSVLLWTRAVPLGHPDQSIPVCVSFKIFDNAELEGRPLDSGDAFTSYDVDFTLKVEAKHLKPDTAYWYQFANCANAANVSPVGTTRTISSPDTPAHLVNGGKPLTFAVFSCARYQDAGHITCCTTGYFNAYGVAAHDTSADIFVHLGDYIYESLGDGYDIPLRHSPETSLNFCRAPIGRETLGRELATIEDYRGRLNQYRTDVSLVAAHQKAPWIAVCVALVLTDHWQDRKLAAVRAYHEWMPIRQVDPDDKLRVWRNFQFGKLLDLTMLDTRPSAYQLARANGDGSQNVGLTTAYIPFIGSIADEEDRSLMGLNQEAWLYSTLSASKKRGAIWRVIGTFMPMGDSHANWVSDLAPCGTATDNVAGPNDTITYDPLTGAGAIGVEFAGTAVSSTSTFGAGISPRAADEISRRYVQENDDLQWSEGSYRGFFTLTLNTTTATATYYAMRNVSSANLDAFASAIFVVKAVRAAVRECLTAWFNSALQGRPSLTDGLIIAGAQVASLRSSRRLLQQHAAFVGVKLLQRPRQ